MSLTDTPSAARLSAMSLALHPSYAVGIAVYARPTVSLPVAASVAVFWNSNPRFVKSDPLAPSVNDGRSAARDATMSDDMDVSDSELTNVVMFDTVSDDDDVSDADSMILLIMSVISDDLAMSDAPTCNDASVPMTSDVLAVSDTVFVNVIGAAFPEYKYARCIRSRLPISLFGTGITKATDLRAFSVFIVTPRV